MAESKTREIDRRRLDRMGRLIQVAGGIAAAVVAALGVWLALRDAVGTNANGVKSNREAIIRIEGQLDSQQGSLDAIKIQAAEIRAEQRAHREQLREVKDLLRDLAKNK